MPTKRKMYDCKSCGRKTEHLVNKPSHFLHLVLSIMTLGVWVVVWILLAALSGPPECSQCGKKYRGFRIA